MLVVGATTPMMGFFTDPSYTLNLEYEIGMLILP